MIRAKLYAIIVLHMVLVIVNMAAIPVLCALPIYMYCVYPSLFSILMGVCIATPLISFLVRLASRWDVCPLTEKENEYRKQLGLPRVRAWLGHYLYKPLRNMRRRFW